MRSTMPHIPSNGISSHCLLDTSSTLALGIANHFADGQCPEKDQYLLERLGKILIFMQLEMPLDAHNTPAYLFNRQSKRLHLE